MPRPIPALPPVTSATLPVSLLVIATSPIGIRYCTGRDGTFAKSWPRPSAIVGCAITASRSVGNGKPAEHCGLHHGHDLTGLGADHREAEDAASLSPTRTFMKPWVSLDLFLVCYKVWVRSLARCDGDTLAPPVVFCLV